MLAIATLALGVFVAVAANNVRAAVGAPISPVWTVPIPDNGGGPSFLPPFTTPAGDVIARSSGGSGTLSALQEVTTSGQQIWQLPESQQFQPDNGQSVTDASGNTYVSVNDSTDEPSVMKIDPSGNVDWVSAQNPDAACDCYPSWQLGWNNVLYLSGDTVAPVDEFNEVTGATESSSLPNGTTVLTFDQGLIAIEGQSVCYLNYQEQPLGSCIDPGFGISSSTSGGNGTVFVADGSGDVVEIDPSGIQWSWTAPSSFPGPGATNLAATPDGGVIETAADALTSVSLSATGTMRWIYKPSCSAGGIEYAGGTPAIVDSSGNVVLTYNCYDETANADIVNQASAAAVSTVSYGGPACASGNSYAGVYSQDGADVGQNELYMSVAGACGSTVVPPSVDAFYEPGLAENEWLLINIPDDGASTPGRYVAFGDSVPYGHGLANPGPKSEGDLPPDMGPSSLAYPSIVANQLGLAMSLRTTGCSLSGDNLAVSGAPSQVNQWTGKDTNCHRRNVPVPKHKAGVPDEINAANLISDPPTLVTIQFGADDIDFGGCLAHLLRIPTWAPGLGAVKCDQLVNGQYAVTARFGSELQSLSQGLSMIVSEVHQDDPNAKILLVDYYQFIPQPSAPLVGTSDLCRILRSEDHANRVSLTQQAEYLQGQLNATIGNVSNVYPYVQFVDIADLFSNHEICVANPSDPDSSQSWLFDDNWDAAHPNAAGQQQIAAAIVSSVLSGGSIRRQS
jgi:GDSL-like Lipase/Acylhydrolase family